MLLQISSWIRNHSWTLSTLLFLVIDVLVVTIVAIIVSVLLFKLATALRVHPAVTRLTVYRRLYVCLAVLPYVFSWSKWVNLKKVLQYNTISYLRCALLHVYVVTFCVAPHKPRSTVNQLTWAMMQNISGSYSVRVPNYKLMLGAMSVAHIVRAN